MALPTLQLNPTRRAILSKTVNRYWLIINASASANSLVLAFLMSRTRFNLTLAQ
jgi:hypothetical protein